MFKERFCVQQRIDKNLCHACDKLAHVSSPSSGAEKALLMKRSISTKQIIERILFQYDEVFSKHERFDPLCFPKMTFFEKKQRACWTASFGENTSWSCGFKVVKIALEATCRSVSISILCSSVSEFGS